MDVEKTIQFILDAQAKAEAHMGAIDERLDGVTRRMDGVNKLLQTGMRILVNFQTETKEKINAVVDAQLRTETKVEQLAGTMDQLATAQKVTEEKLQALLDSLREGRNGH